MCTLVLCRVEVIKAVYGQLKKPNVPQNHEWNASSIKKIVSTGDLYIRALLPRRKQSFFAGLPPVPLVDPVGASKGDDCGIVLSSDGEAEVCYRNMINITTPL